MPEKLWTIGHSTRGWDEFVALLGGNGIQAIADVRRFPASRKYPHFNREAMEGALPLVDTQYAVFTDLGGRRPARPDSPNIAWRNASFRGYADYMGTPGFHDALQRLLELATRKRTAMMCAEAVWWRCHRGLIADELKARGVQVLHIEGGGEPKEHPYTAAASIVQGRLSYRSEQAQLL
jgi:uncharacterized protein (DUF488 family)